MLFKNFKVKKSLIGVFSLMFAITLVVAAVLMVAQTTQANSFNTLLDTTVRAKELVSDTNAKINGGASIVRDVVLSPDTADEMSANLDSVTSSITANLDDLAATGTLDDATMTSYRETVQAWMDVVPQVMSLVEANDVEGATNMLLTECSPRLQELSTTTTNLEEQLQAVENSQLSSLDTTILVVNVVIVVLIVILAAFSIFVAYNIIHSMLVPLRELRDAVDGFAQGNLSVDVDFVSKNEFGGMCDSMRKGQALLHGAIEDISYLLEEMADGNFDVRSRDYSYYVGDLERILQAVRAINYKLSDTLGQISLSAEQVAAGADQVSTGAQALAQGATEQASAVEELSATINEISQNSQKNRENSEKAMQNSNAAGNQVQASVSSMNDMVEAMKRISDSSEEISKIIGTIENIAFQTNILALNAAVEAARAGSAGKGFAVVADEVRNLASKSDQAAKATKDFIERSINAVREGNEIVQQVSDSLSKTVDLAGKAIGDMQGVVTAVEEETDSISQVTEGIDQISSVVQTNSATSEESAAASEELSSQAALMKDLLGKFRLRKTEGSAPAAAPSYSAPSAPAADDAGHDDAFSNFSKY